MKLKEIRAVYLFLFIMAIISIFMPFWTIRQVEHYGYVSFEEFVTLYGHQIWFLYIFLFLYPFFFFSLKTKSINTSQILAIIGCAGLFLNLILLFYPDYGIIELYSGFYLGVIPIIGVFFINVVVIPKLKAKDAKEMRKIKESIDDKIILEIEEKIKQGEQFLEEGNLVDAVNNFNTQLERTKSISDDWKRMIIWKKINEDLLKLKILKLKDIIVDLSYKFPRLGVQDIAEKCGEDEELIISAIQDMIKNREVYAEYFKASKTIAFIQQIDAEKIDNLMKSFDEWEKEGKSKKI